MKIGVSSSHIISPVNPEERVATGGFVTVIVSVALSAVQLFVSVTITFIKSPLFTVVVTLFVALLGDREILFLKNSYKPPPVAEKVTVSPRHAVDDPVRVAVGAGSTCIVIKLLISSQMTPLNSDRAIRRKSVSAESTGGS